MILYFSGTGNSRYVAEALAEMTGDAMVNMVSICERGNFRYYIRKNRGYLCVRFMHGVCHGLWKIGLQNQNLPVIAMHILF